MQINSNWWVYGHDSLLLDVCTLTSGPGFESLPRYELSSWCFIYSGINVCTVHRVDIKLKDPSVITGRWGMLKIPLCLLWRVDELSTASWTNYKFLPKPTSVKHQLRDSRACHFSCNAIKRRESPHDLILRMCRGGARLRACPGGARLRVCQGGVPLRTCPGGVPLRTCPGSVLLRTCPGGVYLQVVFLYDR